MREVKPTQNPVPSADIKDLFFNSGLLDIWATSLERKYIDRFGNCHLTAAGMEWLFKELVEKFKVDMNTAIVAAGYITIDSFQQGAKLPNNEITLRNHILRDETTGEYYRWDGDLPKQVPAGSTPQSTGGIGKGAWVSVGDASLRSSRIFTQRPAGVSLTDIVSVKDYGAKGDGITDDTNAIDMARVDSKIIFFPYTEKGYVYKKPVELVGESWIGEGVGRIWGNTAPTILFSGFSSVAAITSNTKTNYLKGLRFMPLSWDSQAGYLGSGLKVDGIINTQDCGFFGFKINNYLSEYTGSNETWLCYHNNTWFGYSGEHGVNIKSGNGSVFINCSSNWSGATEFLQNPTVKADYHGLYMSSTLTEGYTSPEGFILIGGDWSYNAGYGLKVTSGHGGIFQPGYIELNLTGGAFFGGTAKAHDVNMGHIGQSVHFDLESPFTASTVGKYSRAPCSFKANGMDEGIGHRYGDNATTTPSLPLGSEGAVHKMLTTAWGGIYGSILKLMDKTGNMIFKGVAGDSRQMYIKMEDALFSDNKKKIHPIVTTGAIEVPSLPPASADYANSFAFQTSDRKLYYCYYNSTNFTWRAVW